MTELWSIIGLSSLIAAVVTVCLGIVKEVIVENYRFRREKRAEYIQGQIRLYSQLHFLLFNMHVVGPYRQKVLGHFIENARELNEIIKQSSDLLDSRIIKNGLVS